MKTIKVKGKKWKADFAELITLMPAERHLPTASGTAARGGSIMEMRPRKQSLSVGKFMSSQSKVYPRGNWDGGRFRWQKPVVRDTEGRRAEVTKSTAGWEMEGKNVSPF